MPTPEDKARENIDRLLTQAGWVVSDQTEANIFAYRGVALRNFTLKPGHGFADYLLYVDGRAAGVIEAKKEGVTLTGVETQSEKYTKGLPDGLPAWSNPLPFSYESTGVETRFTNGLDPEPRSRPVFSFHKPETLVGWLEIGPQLEAADRATDYGKRTGTFLARMQHMPPLIDDLWPPKPQAIQNLEQSLRENRPRSLVQMATGSGKTLLAIVLSYRLLKFAGARRVLFLVDRGNLGRQTLKEFQQYVSPYNNFKFSEEYIVQRLTSNTLDTTARVCISTIQRLYSMLKGQDLAEEDEEQSVQGLERVFKEAPPIEYNPAIPIETFDIIVTDECHRSIYHLWRQVLEYFDAHIIGLTATPNKQTFGFFNQNLVMEYGHEQAVADGVNVNYDVYRIKTEITEGGSKVDAGYYVDKRDRATRAVRWEQLDEDLQYEANQLDRDVVAADQIRTVIRTFRDKLFTDIFPGRTHVPKTLVFAKDDSHAEDIVKILREEFGKGNDFAQKITYRTTGKKPEDIIAEFRNSYFPRIAVTVDMIATGTDIKPLEVILFMRSVKSRSFFEQMKGRGVRVISEDDLAVATPDAKAKDHYVIVDAVGVCERDKTDSRPMDQRKSIPFDKLLQAVALGNTEPEVISSIAVRLARMNKTLEDDDKAEIEKNLPAPEGQAGGGTFVDFITALVNSLDADRHVEQVYLRRAEEGRQAELEGVEPTADELKQAAAKLIQEAVKPLYDPVLRNLLIELKQRDDQTIDNVSQDKVIEAGFSADALERAKGIVQSFEKFIQDHKDEITALQILYSLPARRTLPVRDRTQTGAMQAGLPVRGRTQTGSRLTFEHLKELANTIQKPPHLWTESQLWQAYAALDKSKVKGTTAKRILTDLVSLVRFAIHQDNELVPFPERVNANFKSWLAQQESGGLPAPRLGTWFVYVIECSNGSRYIGQTRDLQQRFAAHKAGTAASWTKRHPPIRVVHWEEYGSEKEAVEREKALKTGFGRKWLKREIAAGRTRQAGKTFTSDQRRWLEMIRDHIAANLGIDPSDFDYAPFAQEGGLGKVHQLFGNELNAIIQELNGTLAA